MIAQSTQTAKYMANQTYQAIDPLRRKPIYALNSEQKRDRSEPAFKGDRAP